MNNVNEPRGALPTGLVLVNSAKDRFAEADVRMSQRITHDDKAKRAAGQKRRGDGRFK